MVEPQHITFDPGSLQLPYLASLQRTLDVLAVSTLGINQVGDAEYAAFGSDGILRVEPASGLKLPLGKAQEEARHWSLANAFRDAIDATGLFLDGVRDVASIARASAAGTLTAGTLKEITTTEGEAFRKLGIARKVQALREDLRLDLYFYQQVFSVNRVRNCLVHRMGIVSALDVESSGTLKLTYRALEMYSPKPDGSGETIISKPGDVGEAGGAIMMRAVDRTREFRLGERILLMPQEVTDVFSMLMQFSITTVAELQALIEGPAAPAAAAPADDSLPENAQGI
jgi:hypothetical protein